MPDLTTTPAQRSKLLALADKATPRPYEVLPDTRPDVVNKGLRDFREVNIRAIQKTLDAFPDASRFFKNVLRDALDDFWQQSRRDSIFTQSRSGGYFDAGNVVKDVHKYLGHVCELAKYENNPHDAEYIAAACNLAPALAREVGELSAKISTLNEVLPAPCHEGTCPIRHFVYWNQHGDECLHNPVDCWLELAALEAEKAEG